MAEALKDQFFQRPFVEALSSNVKAVYRDFKEDIFLKRVYVKAWDGYPLKKRMNHITACLGSGLPDDYPTALIMLQSIYHQFHGFDAMIFPDFVAQFGLDYFEQSMRALALFTMNSSGEFAVRPFILKYEDRTMAKMLTWSRSENFHVRRLASEGCRPRLPWAMALPGFKANPDPIFPILDNLKNDPQRYVRKSVANNLNDIAKDHPEKVLEIVQSWQTDASPATEWIIRHALRTLLKEGNKKALGILGYRGNQVELENFKIETPVVNMGNPLSFSLELKNKGKNRQQYMVDYIIHFKKARGDHAPKVFKLKQVPLLGGESQVIQKHHPIYAITTRKYYPGEHFLEIQVNGRALGKGKFELKI